MPAATPSSVTTSAAAFSPPARIEDSRWRSASRLAAFIVVFNLVDALLTLAVVASGVAGEANPLMAASLTWGSVPFIAIKLALVSLGVYLLYLRRDRPLAHAALVGLTVVYGAIVLYHASSLHALVRLA
jgi:hypothetical protein